MVKILPCTYGSSISRSLYVTGVKEHRGSLRPLILLFKEGSTPKAISFIHFWACVLTITVPEHKLQHIIKHGLKP